MKLKKTFSFTDKNQIWRLLISDSDKILIETRHIEKKEVFYHTIDLLTGKFIFKNLQLEEKYWIGVEAIYKDKIIFHHYAKPDMPEHKQIIVYDLNENKILWKNKNYSFLTVLDDKIYAFRRKFEGKDVFVLDYLTGEIIESIGNDPAKVNSILQQINSIDYSDYLYPESLTGLESETVSEIILKETSKNKEAKNIEKLVYGDLLFI